MSNHYGANLAIVVGLEHIYKLGLSSFHSFLNTLNDHQFSLDDFAYHVSLEDFDIASLSKEEIEELKEKFETFCEDFFKKTGVQIGLGYHDSSEKGDGYDEVDGAYFFLEPTDVYEKTEAGKNLEAFVPFEAKFYVTYG